MNITIIGTGYVGLVTGTCLAEVGHNSLCVDIDSQKVNQMKAGQVPIYEPQLESYFTRNIQANRLRFTTSLEEGIRHAEVIFLALPTPEDEDGSADMSYVMSVAGEIGKQLTRYTVIVNKSTVPVGTAEKVRALIAQHANAPFDVVSNPEFLREGFAIHDFMHPERVVIGTSSEQAAGIMKKLYEPFVDTEEAILLMDEKSSELTKYAANAFLATKITFMNEIANFCDQVGANVDAVRKGVGSDSRIGSRFLFPGIGFGGSCFPKDIKALKKSGQEVHHQFSILESVIEVNEQQKTVLFPKIKAYFNNQLAGKKIAVWGLAFKPDTDDIRKAPALEMIHKLLSEKAIVTAYDPEAMPNVKKELGNSIAYAATKEDALIDADALLICTEWEEFKTADTAIFKSRMHTPVVFDGRNIFNPKTIKKNQATYFSVGRP
ncbi:MAG: UDP-glucose/GDP-mannose dehydrogenase family protein [Flavobacteriaceae bacterium]|nr:UDP-glucose/GDP-mannose dehydrogenase family protein [Flavobacteriaceae bacterium]MDG2314702.1 UDP-glucose/GDP-mannose dehydrogenase family protein [Flavobacteriaceae bacterium]